MKAIFGEIALVRTKNPCHDTYKVLTRGGKTRNLHVLRSDTPTTQKQGGSYSGADPLILRKQHESREKLGVGFGGTALGRGFVGRLLV